MRIFFLFSDINTPGQVDEEVDGDVRIGVVQFCRLCHLQANIFLPACTSCSMYAWSQRVKCIIFAFFLRQYFPHRFPDRLVLQEVGERRQQAAVNHDLYFKFWKRKRIFC